MFHPFPSLLNGLVAALIAAALGAPALDAVRLGLAMTLLQGAIGAVNDLVDAPLDAIAKPSKPLPAGIVSVPVARTMAVTLLAGGFLLVLPSGPVVLSVAVAGAATGLLYDLRFKGTAASWVPFAIGIPLLPLYGALGAAAAGAPISMSIALLCLLGVTAGAGLAIANAAADEVGDRAAGTVTVATALGHRLAWATAAFLVGGTALAASWLIHGASAADGGVAGATGLALFGVAVVTLGLALGRSRDAGRATRGWELQGLGLGLIAVGWVLELPPLPA